jgi:hypothetical protein
MTANRPAAAGSTALKARRDDAPAPAATDLAHTMLNNGWTLTSATVRVIHTAHLTDDAGLTIAVSSEAGKVRLDFDSEYRFLSGGLSRMAWHAEATRELSVEVLAAVTSANTAASDEDPTEVGNQLTAAGWSQPYPLEQKWISPDQDREVLLIDDELEDTPLPWQISHKVGRPVTIHASEDTPAAVIVALALTTAPAHIATSTT